MTDISTNIVHASPSGDLQAEIARGLAEAIGSLGFPTDGLDLTLRPIPLEGEWGFGSTISFQLRKVGATGNPKDIAQQLVNALPKLPQIGRVEAVNGYVNFYVDRDWYANRIVGQVLTQKDSYGSWPDRGERVMVEYAALNTHKAMHVGHLRNIVLGESVYNILKSAGFETVGATYIGDIGMHVMKVLWAYRRFYNGQEPKEDRGPWLEKLYVNATTRLDYRKNVTGLIADAAREDPAIAAQLSNVLQALADSDPENVSFAEQIAQGLGTKDGPDWKNVLANKDYMIINLWAELGQLLVGQSSSLDASNSDGGSLKSSALADLAADYEKLDANRSWWDDVPSWQAEIKNMFSQWEARDPALVELWERTRQWSLDMFRRIFDDMGVKFAVWFFESEVEESGKLVVDELIQKGIAEDHRAIGEPVIVRVDDKLRAHLDLSKKYEKELWKINKDGTREPKEAWRVLVVLRSDGTSLYATKDLELAKRKFNDWHIDRSIYVIDSRQSLYFQQVFKVLELWGFRQADKAFQLSYEFVITPEGAISSRKGGAPQYEDLEREALRRARAIVDTKEGEQSRDLTEEQKDAIARAVAHGALKMGMLDKDNNKIITFVWEQALNPESQSATYVQYSHARATRVLEKAPPALLPVQGNHYNFREPNVYETNLLEQIARLPEEVARAAEAYKPVIIAMYCFELADAFNNFYHNCRILTAGSEEAVQARLALTAAAKQTTANALGLLGITAPDMM